MECFIHDLDEETARRQKNDVQDDQSVRHTITNEKSTLSGDTTYDKAQTGMTGPSWTGGMGQGENHCPANGPDHHPDELYCDCCRKN
ncbi:unnamed protein product [Adineta ricciae]|uniref:Uncharacterized protein n=1 Tax=Adineta ricciae TaxID=249248 RepID=A0A814PIE4_ADIRI|nr:unnamed protein product [Adineta ricciae]CAF1301174.1 unnamed protein product [Adineta ricciae]